MTALYAFMVLFNQYSYEFLDDYWIEYIVKNHAKVWYYSNFIIAFIFILFVIIFVYNLGKGTNHERKEPLLINEDNQYE